MSFGSASELDLFESDADLSVTEFRAKHGDRFLLVEIGDVAMDGKGFEDTTDSGITLSSSGGPARRYVFSVRKRTNTGFDFIAIGRNVGNDLHVPHPSVSRFHAYFRATGDGLLLQDAKPSSGTTLDDRPVPKQGAGDPLPVTPGQKLRFGAVVAVLLDAAGLIAALRAEGRVGLAAVAAGDDPQEA